MNSINTTAIEKAKSSHLALLSLGALLDKEISRYELTFAELVGRYNQLGLTDDLAKRAWHEYDFARRMKIAKGYRGTGNLGGGHAG
ncbi:hypothetical protein [Cobetia sp. 1CM21F]|uniref:hypothetical protein n=1 Tax=Cobetia sp. 1CM21F TaxID=2929163 RepID=UPI0020BFC72B|nr:hypothetical protein [Cobetia sp. 1CM21F]MCK8068096.1 hypothetical protein [Cobetia sp. 1CM21F]